MRKRNYLFGTCKCLLGFILIVIVSVAALFAWLSTSPKDLTDSGAIIIEALQSEDAPYEIRVDEVKIGLHSWQIPISAHLTGIRLVSAEFETELFIPSGEAGINIWQLLTGSLAVESLVLRDALVHIERDEQGLLIKTPENKPFYRRRPDQPKKNAMGLPFRDITFERGTFHLEDRLSGIVVDLDNANLLSGLDEDGSLSVSYDANVYLGLENFPVEGSIQYLASDERFDATLRLSDFRPVWLCDTVLMCNGLPLIDVPLTGTINYSGQTQLWPPQEIMLSLDGASGTIAAKPYLPERIAIESLALQGRITRSLTAIELANFSIDFGQTTANAYGDAALHSEGFSLSLDADAEMMPVNDLYKYWPQSLAPETRAWATTNIREGMATRASAKIRIKPEDLIDEHLPDAFLEASIAVENSSVNYIAGFPKATSVNGNVRFTGTQMIADIHQATALSGTKVKSATVHMTDLNRPGVPVKSSLKLTSNPRDAVTFLRKLPHDPLRKLSLYTDKATGSLQATVNLAFNAFGGASERINWDKLDYHVTCGINSISNVTAHKSITLNDINGSIVTSNTRNDITLNAVGNGVPYKLSYQSEPKKPAKTSFSGSFPAAVISQYAPAINDYVSGNAFVDASIIDYGGNKRRVSAKLNLKDAGIWVEPIHYRKTIGAPASLTISSKTNSKGRVTNQYGWAYQSEQLNLNGTLGYDAESESVSLFEVERYSDGTQDLGLEYRALHEGYRVKLSGNMLDLTPFAQNSDGKLSISDIPAIRLELDMKNVRFPTQKTMTNVKGHLHCHEVRCESADLKANLPKNGRLSIRIYREDGKRKFSLNSTQMGQLLRVLDIHDKMSGGTADINGTYLDEKAKKPLYGRAIVTDFIIKDAPILGRVLNISSLTGLFGSLSGEGIKFDKFAGDFAFARDLLKLRNGKASGASLGILIDGDINIANHMLDISGNLAPAHVVNSLIGKIPVLGEALAGGEGESIIAINYSVKGDMDEPNVVANPLSALTPGFTRRFFDIFDSPPDTRTAEQKEADKQKAENAPTAETNEPKEPEWQGKGPNTRVIGVESRELLPPTDWGNDF